MAQSKGGKKTGAPPEGGNAGNAAERQEAPPADEAAENGDGEMPPLTRSEWIELAKIAQGRIENRRDLEWKLAFGFWGAIAAFTAARYTFDLQLPSWAPCALLWFYVVMGALCVLLWQVPLQNGYSGDRAYLFYYLDMAKWQKDDGQPAPKHPPLRDGTWRQWIAAIGSWHAVLILWFLGQVLFTFLLMLLSWALIVHCPPKEKDTSPNAPQQTDAAQSVPAQPANAGQPIPPANAPASPAQP